MAADFLRYIEKAERDFRNELSGSLEKYAREHDPKNQGTCLGGLPTARGTVLAKYYYIKDGCISSEVLCPETHALEYCAPIKGIPFKDFASRATLKELKEVAELLKKYEPPKKFELNSDFSPIPTD